MNTHVRTSLKKTSLRTIPMFLLLAALAGCSSAPVVTEPPDVAPPPPPPPPVLPPAVDVTLIGDIGDQEIQLGSTLKIELLQDETASAMFSVAPLPLPANAGLNAMTGVFTFRPDSSQVGDIRLTFAATVDAATTSESITVTVLPPASDGTTALTGKLLDGNAATMDLTVPIVGAIVTHLETGDSTTTDSDGSFFLSNLPAGENHFEYGGSPAAPDGGFEFVGYRATLNLDANVTNVIDRPIFLVRLDTSGQTEVDPGATTTLNNENIGVALTIPPNTVMDDSGGLFSGMISLSEVPTDFTPGSLPEALQPALVVTVQPMGLTFDQPVPVTFPNTDNLAPGSELDLWSLDHSTGEFFLSGTGRVSADGTEIVSIDGGIRAASWHFYLPPESGAGGRGNSSCQCKDVDCTKRAGSEASVSSGALTVDHALAGHRSLGRSRALRFVYNSNWAFPQPILSSDVTNSVRADVPATISSRLSVAGVDQGLEVFTDTSGLNQSADDTIVQSFLFDASNLATGIYAYELTHTSHYGLAAVSSVTSDSVLVNNQRHSPFGAGWTLEGLTRLHPQQGQSVLLVEGNGSARLFSPGFGPGTPFFNNDFEGGVPPEWSVTTTDTPTAPTTDTTPTGARSFLGQFGNDTVTFTLGALPEHLGVTVRFDLFVIQSWDGSSFSFGPDVWSLKHVNGPTIERTTFSNAGKPQAFPNMVDEDLNDEQTGAVEIDTLGYSFFGDSVYHLSFTFPHTDSSLALEFAAEGLQALSDESWGLDNVAIDLHIDLSGFSSPPGDFSTLVKNDDGSFTRTLAGGTRIEFNSVGAQTAVIDTNGTTTTYAYDGAGRLVSITDPVGLVTTMTYGGNGLSSITDSANRTTLFEVDADGNLVGITDADNTTRQFEYDGRNHLIAQTSKRGFVTEYAYDSAGRFVRSSLPDGSTREVSPSDSLALVDSAGGDGTQNNPVPVVRPEDVTGTSTDGNGNETSFSTNPFGASKDTVDPLGRQTSSTRDENGNPLDLVSANGTVTAMTYDSRSNLLSVVDAQGLSEQTQTRFSYESTSDRITSITDPGGNKTTFAYDANGNVTRTTNALGDERTMTYDSRGLPLTVTDGNGNTTTFTYDRNGNVATITDALGNVSNLSRDAAGNVTSATDGVGSPQQRTRSFTYDSLNRRLSSTDGSGATIQTTYDAAGNVVALQNETGETTSLTYDALNRVTTITRPAKGTTRFTYDGNGNVVRSEDALGNVTTHEYDSANQLVKTVDALGGRQTFTYDSQGSLVSLEDSLGQTTTFEYDALNRQTRKTNALGQSTTFTYDSRGNLLTITNPEGQVTRNTYDELSRLTSSTTADNTTSLTYDAAGNLLTLVDNDSSLSFSYDGLNRVITEQTLDVGVQAAVTITNTYDAVGNRIGLADTEGGTTVMTYDAEDRLARLVPPAGGNIDFDYDAAGGLTHIMFPNGVTSDFQYDSSGRLTGVTHTAAGGTALIDLTYTRNDAGDILSTIKDGQTSNITYNALRALTGASTSGAPETYTYDAGGNRLSSHLSATHQYDAAGRLLEDDTFTYVYDANGSLITKTAKNNGGVTSYTWDGQKQLTQIDFPDGSSATYRYDGLGRRIEKNVDGTITRYVYDGAHILLEYDGTNALVARYTHGSQVDQPLSMERGGQSFYYHADHLGSVRRLSNAAGTAVNTLDYDSYGRPTTLVEGVANPFSFTGRERDAESGLYFYRSRYYEPDMGRFISQDPAGFLGGDSNVYAYVGNNPINGNDPTGLTNLVTTIPPIGQLARTLIQMGVRPELLANSARGLATLEEIAAFELTEAAAASTVAEVGAATTVAEAGAATTVVEAGAGGTAAGVAGGTTLAGVAAATGVGLVIAAVVISPWAYSAYSAIEGGKLSERQAALSKLRLQVFRAQKDPCLSRADKRRLRRVENMLNLAISEGGDLGEKRGRRVERLLATVIRNSVR